MIAEAGVSKTVPTGTLVRTIEKSYVDQDGEKVTVMAEETTKGVKYGATLLPFTGKIVFGLIHFLLIYFVDADKKAMEYKAGPKGISVLCFTKLAQLNRMFVMGQGCHVVVARKGDEVFSFNYSYHDSFLSSGSCDSLVCTYSGVAENGAWSDCSQSLQHGSRTPTCGSVADS